MGPRILIPLLSILATAAYGQSLYVSDELVITLRTGPSTTNQIIENLRSGDSVEVLETNDDGYTRVRTSAGDEGWVLTRYLVEQPIARDRLALSESQLADARARMSDLEQELATVSGDLESTTQRLGDAEEAATTMNAELVDIRSASANAVTLRDQNESLRRRLNEQDQQLEQAALEIQGLRTSAGREWFVVGAGVLLAGIVVGLIVPSLRKKRRSEW